MMQYVNLDKISLKYYLAEKYFPRKGVHDSEIYATQSMESCQTDLQRCVPEGLWWHSHSKWYLDLETNLRSYLLQSPMH